MSYRDSRASIRSRARWSRGPNKGPEKIRSAGWFHIGISSFAFSVLIFSMLNISIH